MPVSYTHLDVYKRQTGLGVNSHTAAVTSLGISTSTGPLRPLCAMRKAARMVSAKSSTPVSYTHLDVYKRQIKTLARCFYPSMVEFFNSEEGQREYEEWLKEQEALQALSLIHI